MRIILTSYRERHGLIEEEEEVTQVEFSPETEEYLGGKEQFVGISLDASDVLAEAQVKTLTT